MRLDLGKLVAKLDSLKRCLEGAEMVELLKSCEPTDLELSKLCIFDDKHYSRNYVVRSENFELLVMCWLQGQRSAIHDHGSSQCAVKVLEGVAEETIFTTESEKSCKPIQTICHGAGAVFLDSASAIHQISNNESSPSPLVTLHLYSPPLVMGQYSLDTAAADSLVPVDPTEEAHVPPTLR